MRPRRQCRRLDWLAVRKNCWTISRLGRQACGFPGQDTAGKMRAVWETLLLCRQRRGHGSAAGTAREYHLAPGRIRNSGGIEAGQRNQNSFGETLEGGLVRLAN